MQLTLVLAISLHVLAATFWAGSSFAMARMAGHGSEKLFAPQMVAATLAILTGAYLWHTLHEGSFAITEHLLGVGALAAVIALAIQATVVGGALQQLRRSGNGNAKPRSHITIGHRAAALLLAIAAAAMAAARYA